MVDLVYTEILKLKRSKMFLLTFIGALVAPFLVVVSTYIHVHSNEPTEQILFAELFFDTNLYTTLLIGVPLYGVATAYLFSREYAEDTLKNLLTIPVSRTGILVSKMLLLFVWIIALTMEAWGLTLLLGMLGQFDGLTLSLLLQSFTQFIVAGSFLFVLSTPVILITLLLKNYVPAIILTIVITLINVMGGNSEYKGLIPWTAAFDIVNGMLLPEYPAIFSYISIALPSIGCFIAALLYFRKADIH
ncbi:bacitracin transport system permease protein [Paenibacillus endophyticus]|uniref:Bacitracin transport system permease protein n=1 Tax=Paenibacillus endophyticus TaxID=1294268 RepID=A0A7W5C389_9BACL|nr:ABC transporter permease [Paenibacillus endophyticus]MBB3150422.1 bacitracin transport system permease protein [Paenibacillus endophyticus]